MFCGLGRSNLCVLDMFLNSGAKLIAGDIKPEKQFDSKVLDDLKAKDVELRFGENYLNDLNFDIILRTPVMNFYSEQLNQAREKNIVVTSETELFLDFCPCKIIGVTGSDGKTTTSTIISEILKKEGYNVHLGGNIGEPLLPKMNLISPNDIAVLELSSFQLISMRKSPDVSVITNVSPNHLDIHNNMEEYIFAKKQIFVHQNAFSKTVLNFNNEITKKFEREVRGKTYFFSSDFELRNGVFADENGDIIVKENEFKKTILNKTDINLVGLHNLENYLAAICAVWEYVSTDSIQKVAKCFTGVEHRIEFVREVNGVKYYNDSIASSPTRTIKGVFSLFKEKIILIAGGYDKKIPFNELAKKIKNNVSNLILLGDTAKKIEEEVLKLGKPFPKIFKVKNMKEAIDVAKKNARKGDTVVLSPACASFGLYKNFEERGKDFKRIVNLI